MGTKTPFYLLRPLHYTLYPTHYCIITQVLSFVIWAVQDEIASVPYYIWVLRRGPNSENYPYACESG